MKRLKIILLVVLPLLIILISFRQVWDKTDRKRDEIEYIVIHYTANLDEGADAYANARYLQREERAGTHYCIDDKEIVQCTPEDKIAYAVGDKHWLGFIPKPWLKNKVKNKNSLNYEMCLGGSRNDSLIIETTAKAVAWQMVNKGFYNSNYELDLGRIVRHHDVTGKHCPKFFYKDEWNQWKEDRQFWLFKKKVEDYAIDHMIRLNKFKYTNTQI